MEKFTIPVEELTEAVAFLSVEYDTIEEIEKYFQVVFICIHIKCSIVF